MTVQEMLERLSKMPPNNEVVFHYHGEIFTAGPVYQVKEGDLVEVGTVVVDINFDEERSTETWEG